MDWDREKATWPMSGNSRFSDVRPHHWHIQEAGSGRTLLLLHGAGATTHSWRLIFPLLAAQYHVVAIDLPGLGFTKPGTRRRRSLDLMATDIASLITAEGWEIDTIVGHSAGGALALELDRLLSPKSHILINPALDRFDGVAGWLFPIMAKFLAMNPMVPSLFAKLSGSEKRVKELLKSTGSEVDDAGLALYQRLMSDRDHLDGSLLMMAQWSVDGLAMRLPEITTPVMFIVGGKDGTVPPKTSDKAAEQIPNAEIRHLPDLGHLLHEEEPQLAADLIATWAARHS